VLNVLFLCTGNSARSILAEVLLNELGRGDYMAYSAGSQPAGTINPGALEKLRAAGHSVDALASKSWDEFSGKGAPAFDVVITVCDNAAGESCPLWNGSPVVAHWGIPDPAAFEAGEERRKAFDRAYVQLRTRIEAFLRVPHKRRTPEEGRAELRQIHERANDLEAGIQ
jgi:arsenate reductase